MRDLALGVMTREMCHTFYQHFENDPATFVDESQFVPYCYGKEQVDLYFDQQQKRDRIVFLIHLGDEWIGEIKIRDIDLELHECSFGIHLINDSVKGKGYGTAAEKLAVQYAFEQLEMKAVNAICNKNNTRSQHVLEKVGFQRLNEDRDYIYYRCERKRTAESDSYKSLKKHNSETVLTSKRKVRSESSQAQKESSKFSWFRKKNGKE